MTDMKFTPAFYIVITCLFAVLCDVPATAQDGIIFSAQPPITVRYVIAEAKVFLTNTSDKVLHGITVTNTNKDGEKSSKVIADTIEAHKTVVVDFMWQLVDGNLTCTNYSKPLPVKFSP